MIMSKAERKAYDRHIDNIMVQNDVLDTAKMEGRKEGRKEAIRVVHPRIALVSLLDIIIKAANSLSLWFPNHIGYERQLIISGLRSKGLLICQYRVQR